MKHDEYFDVAVYPHDKVPEELTEIRRGYNNEFGYWMKRQADKDRSCIALDTKTKLCTIYKIRPCECRTFNQDHPLCKKIRIEMPPKNR
jgi:Fe-S-cluster containining protein